MKQIILKNDIFDEEKEKIDFDKLKNCFECDNIYIEDYVHLILNDNS